MNIIFPEMERDSVVGLKMTVGVSKHLVLVVIANTIKIKV